MASDCKAGESGEALTSGGGTYLILGGLTFYFFLNLKSKTIFKYYIFQKKVSYGR